MIAAYDDYLSMPMSLSAEEMATLHKDLADEIGDDRDSLELYEELIITATRYMIFRSNWLLWSNEEKRKRDPDRTSCHDSLIVKFNQLARYLQIQGKPAAWRDQLGYEEENRYFRKRIGDFGCYLVFVNSVLAR
ncbi:MAG: hypothetical protein HFG75_09020 [Hungatella sp.]|nr:hypothetical protein [Hungatella sp.]